MASLSQADKQNLNADQQKQVLALKEQWAAANAAGDQAAMDKAHAAAEAIRASSTKGAYSGGTSGNAYSSLSNGGNNPYMKSSTANGNAALSGADNAYLSADLQQQIANLKAAWAQANAAGDQVGMDAAHREAEAIRQSAGYSGGANGAGYNLLGANTGGMTADQMKQWLEDYMYTNYKTGTGWTNGYSTAMNVRSKANKVRQQMLANEQAMENADANTKAYLHEQNQALAQLLYDYTGQSQKNTWYNEQAGRWETLNNDVGYGYYVGGNVPGVSEAWKKYYGYTDDDIERFATDTSLYYNFVDPRTVRLATDESSGYTGKYSQFVNGPYAQLLGGGTHDGSVNMSIYQDMNGDGFGDEGAMATFTPIRDENGNVINATAPALKNNNAMSDYTNQFTSYVANGVIQPGILAASHPGGGSSHGGVQKGTDNGMYSLKTNGYVDASDPRYTGGINRDVAASTAEDPNNIAGQLAYYENYGKYGNAYGSGGGSILSGLTGGTGGSGYEDYINQMYAAALESQMAQLESSYNQNVSELDTAVGKVDDTYTEQKRQTTGTNAQEAANWREMANAYGLNSGAIGQAALAQNNQLQSNLNTLESAQAAALTELEQQRTLLGQQYQQQINQALSENNFNKAQALYQEAVRQDEMMLQKMQFAVQTALQMAQMAMQQSQFQQGLALDYAKLGASSGGSSGRSGGSGSGGVVDTSKTLSSNDALYTKLYAAADKDANPQNFIAANYKDYGFSNSSGLWAGYQDWAENAHSSDDIISRLNNTTYQSANNTTANALAAQLRNDMSLTNEQKLNVAQMAYQNGHISSRQLTQMLDSLGL